MRGLRYGAFRDGVEGKELPSPTLRLKIVDYMSDPLSCSQLSDGFTRVQGHPVTRSDSEARPVLLRWRVNVATIY
jgi:hypothetical protein